MNRRSFAGIIAATPALANAAFAQSTPAGKTGCFVLQHYYLQLGSQATRLADYLTRTYLPAVAKVHSTPTLVLDAQLAPHLPLVTVVSGYQSVGEMWNVRTKLNADKAFEAATDAWQAGGETPYDSMTTELLEAAEFSPDFAPLNPQPKLPRIFEMRIYQTRTLKRTEGTIRGIRSENPCPRGLAAYPVRDHGDRFRQSEPHVDDRVRRYGRP